MIKESLGEMGNFIENIFKKLRACWLIFTHKEFYLEVVTAYYDDGNELSCDVSSNIPYTETAIHRLQKGLNISLQMIKNEKKRNGRKRI